MNETFVQVLLKTFLAVTLKLLKSFSPLSNVDTNSITVLTLHNLGDAVFTIPAIKKIIIQEQGRRINVVTYSNNIPIYKIVFPEPQYFALESDFSIRGRIPKLLYLKAIRQLRSSVFYDLTGSPLSEFISAFSGAQKIIGTNHFTFECIYDRFVPLRNIPHLMDRYLQVIDDSENIKNENIKHFYRENISNGEIIIFPFAGWEAKEWGFRKFLELANRLNINYAVRLLIDKNRMSQTISSLLDGEPYLITVTNSIQETISLLRECALIISNDTGPLYIASLLGKPTITIYGPTNPSFSLPYGTHHKFIRKLLACSPTSKQYCDTWAGRNCPHVDCMKLLTVDEVYTFVSDSLIELGINLKHKDVTQ